MKKLKYSLLDLIPSNLTEDELYERCINMRDVLDVATETFINRLRLNLTKEKLANDWYETVVFRKKRQAEENKKAEKLLKLQPLSYTNRPNYEDEMKRNIELFINKTTQKCMEEQKKFNLVKLKEFESIYEYTGYTDLNS